MQLMTPASTDSACLAQALFCIHCCPFVYVEEEQDILTDNQVYLSGTGSWSQIHLSLAAFVNSDRDYGGIRFRTFFNSVGLGDALPGRKPLADRIPPPRRVFDRVDVSPIW